MLKQARTRLEPFSPVGPAFAFSVPAKSLERSSSRWNQHRAHGQQQKQTADGEEEHCEEAASTAAASAAAAAAADDFSDARM